MKNLGIELLEKFNDQEIKGLVYFANQINGMGIEVTPENLHLVKRDALHTEFLGMTFTYAGAKLMVKTIELLNS